MTVPQSESSGFFIVVLPDDRAAAAPRVFSVQASLIASGCFSDLDFYRDRSTRAWAPPSENVMSRSSPAARLPPRSTILPAPSRTTL